MTPLAAALLTLAPLPAADLASVAAGPPAQAVGHGGHETRIEIRADQPLTMPGLGNLVVDSGRASNAQAQTALSLSVSIRP